MSKPSRMQQRLATPKHLRNNTKTPAFIHHRQIKIDEVKLSEGERTVLFMSRHRAAQYKYGPDDVLISISDCDAESSFLKLHHPKAILELKFNVWTTTEERHYGIVEFNRGHADQIAVFLKEYTQGDNPVGNIVVHCNQGEQRSRAVAEGIAAYFNLKYYTVNRNLQVIKSSSGSSAPVGEYGYLLYNALDKHFDD